ncbi:hypothetical protein [Buchnera aphidicola]|uniref:hypothetical protein n=1 Tax=Buchnera aphidicola TaxID=9 RepID=UPI003464B2A1
MINFLNILKTDFFHVSDKNYFYVLKKKQSSMLTENIKLNKFKKNCNNLFLEKNTHKLNHSSFKCCLDKKKKFKNDQDKLNNHQEIFQKTNLFFLESYKEKFLHQRISSLNKNTTKKVYQKHFYNINKDISETVQTLPLLSNDKFSEKNFIWKNINKFLLYQDKTELLFSLQDSFYQLLYTNDLNHNFDIYNPLAFFQFNTTLICNNSPKVVLDSLKKFFPNLRDRQLISSYANMKILEIVRKNIIRRFPGVIHFSPFNFQINYIIKKLKDEKISLKIIYLSDFSQLEKNFNKKYENFGMKAKCILFKDKIPNVKYYFYVK